MEQAAYGTGARGLLPGHGDILSGPRRRCGGAAELVAELDESGACGNAGHHRCPGPGGPGHAPPPVSRWSTYRLSPGAGPLKDIKGTVDSLAKRAYPTVNGKRAFRAFRAIDGSPGVTLEQISASIGVDEKAVQALLEPMVGAHVITVQANGHYLDVSGRGLLADSQRRSRSGVKRRWGSIRSRAGSTPVPSGSITKGSLRPSSHCADTASPHSRPWASSSKRRTGRRTGGGRSEFGLSLVPNILEEFN